MRAERLRNQRLTGPGLPGPVDVITWLGAVQAQDFAGALWALAQRIASAVTADDLLTAFDAGAFIRTHILRPTWHVVAAEDLRWMLALSAPRVQAVCSRGHRRLGIDARTRLRAERVMQRALEGGRHLTRHDVAAALRRARIATEDQRLVYLLMHAELEGLICSGARHAGQHTYALVDERVPAAARLVREEALARLMRRYFTSHGPATAKDAAWWSGLTLGDVREGVALAGDALEDRVIEGRHHWQGRGGRASRMTRGGVVHLLSNFDEYTVAYRDRCPAASVGADDVGDAIGAAVAAGDGRRPQRRHMAASAGGRRQPARGRRRDGAPLGGSSTGACPGTRRRRLRPLPGPYGARRAKVAAASPRRPCSEQQRAACGVRRAA